MNLFHLSSSSSSSSTWSSTWSSTMRILLWQSISAFIICYLITFEKFIHPSTHSFIHSFYSILLPTPLPPQNRCMVGWVITIYFWTTSVCRSYKAAWWSYRTKKIKKKILILADIHSILFKKTKMKVIAQIFFLLSWIIIDFKTLCFDFFCCYRLVPKKIVK